MSLEPTRLREALDALGSLLDAIGMNVELAVVGGGALILSGVHVRPTEDIDVVAQWDGAWLPSQPLPAELVGFARDVGRAYDLPIRRGGRGRDWLNAAPSFLMPDDLPVGFFERTTVHGFGALTVHVPCSVDLVQLKVLSATRVGRGEARRRDVADLVQLAPTSDVLEQALAWVEERRPSPTFWTERARWLLRALEQAGLSGAAEVARRRGLGEAG